MLHAKNYFSFFGMLASGVNMQLLSLFASIRMLEFIDMPSIDKKLTYIQNAVKNQTKIQR